MDVNVSDKLTVSSGWRYSGGFGGIATIGWAVDLGKGVRMKNNLLGGVVDSVVKLFLSSNQMQHHHYFLAGVKVPLIY